jgi:DnaJ-class molecular chaperone
MTTPISTEPVTCRNCDGDGVKLDYRYAGVSHKRTEVKRTCRPCKGEGQIVPTAPVVEHDTEIGEIPDWMLEGCTGE